MYQTRKTSTLSYSCRRTFPNSRMSGHGIADERVVRERCLIIHTRRVCFDALDVGEDVLEP